MSVCVYWCMRIHTDRRAHTRIHAMTGHHGRLPRAKMAEGEEEEEEEEEGSFKAGAVNEEDPERDRATQV